MVFFSFTNTFFLTWSLLNTRQPFYLYSVRIADSVLIKRYGLRNLLSIFFCVFIQSFVFWSRSEYHDDIHYSANYSFSAISANEWLTIFYSRGRNNSLPIVLLCNLCFTALFSIVHWSAAFLIILLYMQFQFCQVALMPTSYCISYCERNKDVTLGIRLRHTFWDKEAQRPVRQSKQMQKQTNVAVHSWFPGTLFILLITADSKILSKK